MNNKNFDSELNKAIEHLAFEYKLGRFVSTILILLIAYDAFLLENSLITEVICEIIWGGIYQAGVLSIISGLIASVLLSLIIWHEYKSLGQLANCMIISPIKKIINSFRI